jgi:hypothetical protein
MAENAELIFFFSLFPGDDTLGCTDIMYLTYEGASCAPDHLGAHTGLSRLRLLMIPSPLHHFLPFINVPFIFVSSR